MATDYQRKYIEMIKLYHELHSAAGAMGMKLTIRIRDSHLLITQKQSLNELVLECSDKMKKIDEKFRDLIRVDWKPTVIS